MRRISIGWVTMLASYTDLTCLGTRLVNAILIRSLERCSFSCTSKCELLTTSPDLTMTTRSIALNPCLFGLCTTSSGSPISDAYFTTYPDIDEYNLQYCAPRCIRYSAKTADMACTWNGSYQRRESTKDYRMMRPYHLLSRSSNYGYSVKSFEKLMS